MENTQNRIHEKSRLAMLLRVVVFALVVLCLTGMAAVDKLSDFREAASKDGCQAIPYQTERGTCDNRSRDKDRICRDFSCDIAEVKKDLETYKEKKQNLQNAKDRKDEQSARNLEATVAALEAKLKGHVSLARQLIDSGYDCLAARENVQRSFSDAKEMVARETDSDLKQYVPTLVRKYEQGRDEHVVPMQQTVKAIDNCKWVKEISW